ncbi:MAG: TPM domain-containing protein, partial [Bacteroidota bacterium]
PEEKLLYDYVEALNVNEAITIGEKLAFYQEKTATRVVIVNIYSLGDYTAQEVADSLYTSWEINKNKEDAVLVLVSAQEKAAALAYSEVLAVYIGDSAATRIREEILIPGLINQSQANSFLEASQIIVQLCHPDLRFEDLLSPKQVSLQDILSRPSEARPVNDFADLMSEEEEQRLNQKLRDYNTETSTQIVIVNISSLEGRSIEEVANQIARNWGIGQKGQNNGVLILTSYSDRKVRIEVGYGLEPFIPDLMAKDIIDKYLTPNYKAQNFSQGLDQASDVIIKLTEGEFHWIHVRRFWSWTRVWSYGFLALFGMIALSFNYQKLVYAALGSLVGGTALVELTYQWFGPEQHWHMWLPLIVLYLVIIGNYSSKEDHIKLRDKELKDVEKKLKDK